VTALITARARASLLKVWRRAISCILIGAASIFSVSVSGEEMKSDTAPAILQQLKSFRQMGSVLYIAAHPDDENTELLAYLSRGRNYRTAYLSLTRGDGGQNALSPDLGAKLGVARTQELLAARKIDGAQQFFTRAVDFGYSKNYTETFTIWDKEQVLSDIVRVIRVFRPDVLITRFSPSPGGTHGHHTASAVLAIEAFKLAGDAKAFPEQGLQPWQPKRIFWNISTFQSDKAVGVVPLKIEIGGKDPISGETFEHLAELSRAMHKTQGFDTFQFPGPHGGTRVQSFQLLDGPAATHDILDDIDISWNRIAGGAPIEKSIDEIIAKFDPEDPSVSVPALLELRKQLAGLATTDPVVKEKRNQLDHILQACLGLKVETTTSHSDIVPGEQMKLHHSATIDSHIPVRWLAVRYPTLKREIKKGIDLRVNEIASWNSIETLPIASKLTQPYWLSSEGTPGTFHVDDANLIGTAENSPAFPIENIFLVSGQTLVIPDEPVQITTNVAGKQIRRRLEVIPPVSLRFLSEVILLAPGDSHTVDVEITASRADSNGSLQLEAPSNWKIAPLKQTFHLTTVGEHKRFKFTVTAPEQSSTVKIIASAKINGVRYSNQREEISYAHIPPQLLQPIASVKAVSLEVATHGHTIGYLPGAGDSVADCLEQMGYSIKILDDRKLTVDELSGLDAIVIGVRAFNVRKNIAEELPAVFAYVKNGGTVVAQYNLSNTISSTLKINDIAPYKLQLSRDRVTDQKAAITFLAPENPVLNTPNKITLADFDGWVQERGLYFPDKWDEHFTPIIACNDPGEPPLKGGLLVAKYGKGYFIYTGLSFFRQLPAGVPGAYRLFANLISIGK
jgi:LmbE family N-acetylglucosaminyl deacetylase